MVLSLRINTLFFFNQKVVKAAFRVFRANKKANRTLLLIADCDAAPLELFRELSVREMSGRAHAFPPKRNPFKVSKTVRLNVPTIIAPQ